MLKIGLIGAGANTRSRHVPGLRAIPDVETGPRSADPLLSEALTAANELEPGVVAVGAPAVASAPVSPRVALETACAAVCGAGGGGTGFGEK